MDPATEPPASVTFGRFRVLPHRRELLADGRPIKLGGRAFDVLMALIEARGAVVAKDALMARVWPDRIVEENNLQAQLSALRKAFGADRDLIRTVSGRGYQFAGEVRILVCAKTDCEVGDGQQPIEFGPWRVPRCTPLMPTCFRCVPNSPCRIHEPFGTAFSSNCKRAHEPRSYGVTHAAPTTRDPD
jgi:DNA-binding winged helix-turn-helix (wHTH) protein